MIATKLNKLHKNTHSENITANYKIKYFLVPFVAMITKFNLNFYNFNNSHIILSYKTLNRLNQVIKTHKDLITHLITRKCYLQYLF